MTIALHLKDTQPNPKGKPYLNTPSPTPRGIEAKVQAAFAHIAPVWPLETFIACNPFLGFEHESFETVLSKSMARQQNVSKNRVIGLKPAQNGGLQRMLR